MTDSTRPIRARSPERLPRWSVEPMRIVILLFAVFLAGGLGWPWFYSTTTIYRADLPVNEINDLEQTISNSVTYNIPIYLNLTNASEDFITRAQSTLNAKLYGKYPNLENFWGIELKRLLGNSTINEFDDYIIDFEILPDPIDDDVEVTESYFISPFSKLTKMSLTNKVILSKNVGDFISRVILDEMFRYEIAKFSDLKAGKIHKNPNDQNVVFPYSPNYNLIFSLFAEDGKIINWQIENVSKLITPLLQTMNHYTNFTISTQIQYYSALNVPVHDEDHRFVIKKSDLSTFINHNDWNLNNNDLNPTINFITYFPKSNYLSKPMVIENSTTNSFLVPQWGGIHIFNKHFDVYDHEDHFILLEDELIAIFETFASQLFQLLGVPYSDISTKSLSIRIDSLTRLTIYNNYLQSISILKSLIKLTNELNEISIPENTKESSLSSIRNLKSSISFLHEQKFNSAMYESSQSLKHANNAFFDKQIVQQVYFPSEHKLAVFLPLVGPICSILTFASIKQFKDWRRT